MMTIKDHSIELIDKKLRDIIFIIISFSLSWIIALSADITQLKLGLLGHFFFPPIVATITIIAYLIGDKIIKRNQTWLLLSCCTINLIIGLIFYHFGT